MRLSVAGAAECLEESQTTETWPWKLFAIARRELALRSISAASNVR
jgi:hypothetical protein